jgi:hypothetical protein
MCFTWFNPGSGTGYTFAIANLTTLVLVTIAAGLTAEVEGFAAARGNFNWLVFVTLAAAYVIAYLGAGRLIVLLLRQLGRVTMLLAFLVNLFLAVIGVALPLFFQAWLEGYGRMSYSKVQATNWAWTLEEAGDGSLLALSAVPLLIYCGAAVIFLLNLLFAIYEVEQVRLATPERVLHDELQRHPASDASPVRTGPWDEPAANQSAT